MAINGAVVGSKGIEQNTLVAIEMLLARPNVNQILSTAVSPNTLYGYYNASSDRVELYITDYNGQRYLRVS